MEHKIKVKLSKIYLIFIVVSTIIHLGVSFTLPFVYVIGVKDGLQWMAYYVYTPVHVGMLIGHII